MPMLAKQLCSSGTSHSRTARLAPCLQPSWKRLVFSLLLYPLVWPCTCLGGNKTKAAERTSIKGDLSPAQGVVVNPGGRRISALCVIIKVISTTA